MSALIGTVWGQVGDRVIPDMYYHDLSRYEYTDSCVEKPAFELNVGWLDNAHPFPTGELSEEFLDALFECCHHPVNEERGYHICDICKYVPENPLGTTRMRANRNGRILAMGRGEIRVEGINNIVYAAPTLIYHYCIVHSYKPPLEFVTAVLSGVHSKPTEQYTVLAEK